jgi:hypothetical protein
MGLQDVDGLNRVFDIPSQIDRFYSLHRINSHRREQIIIATNHQVTSQVEKNPKDKEKNQF